MTPHPEALEERRAEIAERHALGKGCPDDIQYLLDELSRLTEAHAAREEVAWARRAETALRTIRDTFAADMKHGYRTSDKQFAVDIATFALAARPTPADSPGRNDGKER